MRASLIARIIGAASVLLTANCSSSLSKSGACPEGSDGCSCYGNQTCNGTLQCSSNVCVSVGTGGVSGAGGGGGASSGVGGSAATGGGAGGAPQLTGQLSDWKTTTNVTLASGAHCAFFAKGFVFHVQYQTSSDLNGLKWVTSNVEKAAQNPDGTLGAWSPAGSSGPFPGRFGFDGLQCAYGDGYAFFLESDTTNVVLIRSAAVSDGGAMGTFSVAASVPAESVGGFNPYFPAPGLLAHGGNLIVSAITIMNGPVPHAFATVKGAMAADGTVGAFVIADWGFMGYANPGLTNFAGPTLGWGSFIYKMGIQQSPRVWFMDFQSGDWTDTTQLPVTPAQPRAALWEGFVFLLGAPASATETFGDRVYASAIHPNGVVGNWIETSPLPQAIGGGAALAANGYVYYLGGSSSGSGAASTAYFAKVE